MSTVEVALGRGRALGLLESTRPRQWVKNVLVLAAPAASGRLGNPDAVGRAVFAMSIFVVLAAATYLLNDSIDVGVDRCHPRKCHRPIAAGMVSVRSARTASAGLALVGLAGAAALGWRFALIASCYVVISTWYSLGLKHCAVVELFAVASGFVLRAVGGAEAVAVNASVWFVLTTSFGALFVVTGKRLSEALEFGADAVRVRVTTEAYPTAFLRFAFAVAAVATLVVYCLWAFQTTELVGSATLLFELSVVPVAAALLRYALIVELGRGSAPEEVFLSDRTLQILGLTWVVLFGLGTYLR